MAETITLLVIASFFAALGVAERNFLINSEKHSGRILKLFTKVHTDDGPLSERREIAKAATVDLKGLTDQRQGDVVIPEDIWKTLQIGDKVDVWALAYLPRWVFWSQMMRYRKQPIFMQLNFAIMSIFCVLALLSHIY